MKTSFFLCFFLLVGGIVSGTNYKVLDSRFSPPEYYVGDEVELHLELLLSENTRFESFIQLPEDPWIEIRDVEFSQNEETLRLIITFVSFYPGSRPLPPITMGDVVLKDENINTLSLIEKGNNIIAGPRGQLLIPGTRTFLLILLALLVLIPVVTFGGVTRLIFLVKKMLQEYKEGRAWRVLQRSLEDLRRDMAILDSADFYDQMIAGVKTYLSLRLAVDLSSATSMEVEDLLREKLSPRRRDFLSKLFNYSDLVRFAHKKAPLIDRRSQIEEVEDLAKSIESGGAVE